MMVVPLVVVAVVVLVIVAAAAPSHRSERSATSHAQEILDRRLADGQVSSEEHARRSATLTAAGVEPQRRSTGPLLAAVAVVAMLAVALAWTGTGWDRAGHDRAMAGHMGWTSGDGSAAPPVSGAVTFEVVATELRFAPTTVTVSAGEPVNLTLVNDGRVFHDLTIPTLGFMLDAEPGEQVSGSLTVDEPGSYAFQCSVPGHAAAGMRGTLVVERVPS